MPTASETASTPKVASKAVEIHFPLPDLYFLSVTFLGDKVLGAYLARPDGHNIGNYEKYDDINWRLGRGPGQFVGFTACPAPFEIRKAGAGKLRNFIPAGNYVHYDV